MNEIERPRIESIEFCRTADEGDFTLHNTNYMVNYGSRAPPSEGDIQESHRRRNEPPEKTAIDELIHYHERYGRMPERVRVEIIPPYMNITITEFA